MRTEQEMYDLILGVAREDECIRAVILNGSRANPHAPRDIFQDYDIVYIVTDPAPFIHNLEWLARFGELMILPMRWRLFAGKPSANRTPGRKTKSAEAAGKTTRRPPAPRGAPARLPVALPGCLPER
jgi:hypothetical protein